MNEKYIISEEHLSERDVPILLQCIANELAEKNRLKRLQLFHEGVSQTAIGSHDVPFEEESD